MSGSVDNVTYSVQETSHIGRGERHYHSYKFFFRSTPVILKLVICLIAGINGLHKMQISQRALLIRICERLLLFCMTEIQLTS